MRKNQAKPLSQPPSHAKPPASAAVLAKLRQAVALHQQGQLGPAEVLYREILQTNPRHFDALHGLGVIALQTGHHQIACDLISQAIAINPKQAAAYSNLGNVWLNLNRPEDALACYDRALRLKPDYAEAHNNRGIALQSLNRLEEALTSYGKAVRLQADYAEAHNNRGIVLQRLGRPEEALASHERALRAKPDYADAHYNCGTALQRLQRPEEALACFARAVQFKPDYAEALNNSGVALHELQRSEEALACYAQALRIKPDYAEAHNNSGVAWLALNRPEQALAEYAQALSIKPDYADAHFNAGLALLLTGDFGRGWEECEWRWQSTAFPSPRRDFPQPLWLGKEPLVGKTILLHAEQGLGDTIQFCRYARRVADAGATVLLEAAASLRPLLASLAGVSRLLVPGEPLPAFDYHCPLLSLPLAFGTELATIPADIPYLHNDPAHVQAWRARLGDGALPRVGLVWSGNTGHKNDRNRSIPLAEFGKLACGQAHFISLQKEVREADRAVLEQRPDIAHYGDELADFAETAALVANLDLVISVDTAVAHLAAALGKPVWLLLPANPDWRWLLGRDDSPWYPSMRLFRQPKLGGWESVIQMIAKELGA